MRHEATGNSKKVQFLGLTLSALLLALCVSAEAQQKSTTPRIGWLGVRPDDSTTSFNLFRQELGALGYVEGKNIAFEHRSAQKITIGFLPWLMSWSGSKLP
jgi:hypothetical protein